MSVLNERRMRGTYNLAATHMKQDILAALRADIPNHACAEPARLIGSPCSCVAGLVRAIEIVEATDA